MVNFMVKSQWAKLIDETNKLKDDCSIIKLDIETQDKLYVSEIIKRFSRCKKLEKIQKYVDDNYVHINDEFYINEED